MPKVRPLKVDIHTHILPRDIPRFKDRFGYGGFVWLDHYQPCCARMMLDDGTFFRDVKDNLWDPGARLEDCGQSGVDVQVLSTVPVMFNYWAKPQDSLELSRFLNDHIAGVVASHPRRFVGLGTLPMQDATLAVGELERSVKVLGLKGVQIGTHINGLNLDDPAIFPIFEAAEALEAAIFIHPWDMLGADRMGRYWLRWLVGMPAELSVAMCSMIFGGVLERFPKLRIAFAHGSGAFAGSLGRISHGFEARPDLCAVANKHSPEDYVGKFYVDSLVHDEKTLRFILDVFGERSIALGSDYPFPLGEDTPGKLIQSLPGLSKATAARLLGGTALEWLGMSAEDFTEERP